MTKVQIGSTTKSARVGRSLLPQSFAVIESENAHSRPDVRVEFEVREGVPMCVGVHLIAVGDREVRASDLARIRLNDCLDRAVKHLVLGQVVETGPGEYRVSPSNDPEDGRLGVKAVTEVRRIRKNLDLQHVAEIYRANVQEAPTQAVADAYGVSHRSAVNYVRRARDAGHLGEAIPGKAGERDE